MCEKAKFYSWQVIQSFVLEHFSTGAAAGNIPLGDFRHVAVKLRQTQLLRNLYI